MRVPLVRINAENSIWPYLVCGLPNSLPNSSANVLLNFATDKYSKGNRGTIFVLLQAHFYVFS